MYELPRAKANGHILEAKVGVIGISNDYTFRQTLSPKVKDTLMETEISFSPYDAAELRTILEHRADWAFVDEACDTSAIAKAAALAAQDMGNARQAFDLLHVGAELAEQNVRHRSPTNTSTPHGNESSAVEWRTRSGIRPNTPSTFWNRSRTYKPKERFRRGRRRYSERTSRWWSCTPPRRCRR